MALLFAATAKPVVYGISLCRHTFERSAAIVLQPPAEPEDSRQLMSERLTETAFQISSSGP